MLNEVFMKRVSKKVEEVYEKLKSHPKELPPRCADYIEGVRTLSAELNSYHRDEKHLHNGWRVSQRQMTAHGYDGNFYALLAKELSEYVDIPLFMAMVFDYIVNDDPSQMKWGVVGAKPPLANNKSTHSLTLVVYGGIKEGWWTLDDVKIPPHHFDELDLEIGGPSVWILGDDYEMLKGDE